MISKTWSEFKHRLFTQAHEQHIPISGQFELIGRCNLRCQMCYVRQAANDRQIMRQELTARQWIHLAEEAREAGMLYLLLTGGEVFLRPDFREIYEELSKMGFRITIYTNGTLITPEIATWLGRIPPVNMEVSLYGASAETYSAVTGSAEAYEHALRGVDLLIAEGLPVQLRTTVIKANAADHDKLVELAGSRNRILRYCFYISPRRDNPTGTPDALRLNPYDITQYELKAGTTYSQKVEEIRRKDGLTNKQDVIDGNDQHIHMRNGYQSFKCSAGRSEFWVTWDGKMTPCPLMAEPSSDPLQKGFVTAWQELSDLCSTISSCSECSQCAFKNTWCWSCPARLKNETGSFIKPAPYLCKWAKYRKEFL